MSFHLNRKIMLAVIVLFMSSSQLCAESSEPINEPLVLQNIMRDMGKSMQLITEGISREDWKQVEKNALLVADHPQPPLGEKVLTRILHEGGAQNVSSG